MAATAMFPVSRASEMPDANVPAFGSTVKSGIRFRLSSLLLVPLFFSPLLISMVLVSDELARRRPRMGLEIFAYAAFFALMFIFNWHARAKRNSAKNKSPVFWSLGKGTMFGGIFGVQLLLPVLILRVVKRWHEYGAFLSLWETAQQKIGPELFGFGIILLTFVVIGAATGGLFGLCTERAKGR